MLEDSLDDNPQQCETPGMPLAKVDHSVGGMTSNQDWQLDSWNIPRTWRLGIRRVEAPKSWLDSLTNIGCMREIAATGSTFGCTGHNPQDFRILSGTKILMFGLLLFRFGCLLRCSFFLLLFICSTCRVPFHLIVACVTTTCEAALWSIIEASFWSPWFISTIINPPTRLPSFCERLAF